jgi:hypothetical protein
MKIFLLKIFKNKRDALFFLCVGLNAIVVFSYKYFPTQDSGAHAYNSNILYHLLLGDNGIYNSFYSINPEPVPNLTAHLVMLIFNSFLPFSVAEKIMLLIYFISFPLLFRKLVSIFNSDNSSYLIFLVFPFSHFCALYWGFYNFAFGILFFLLGIIYWTNKRTSFKLKEIIFFFIIVTICYFSHLVAFLALVMFCCIFEFMDFILQLKSNFSSKIFKAKVVLFLKGLIAFLPSLIFTFLYFSKRPATGKEIFLNQDQLNNKLLNGDIFKSYGTGEEISTKPILYLIVIAFLYALISKLKDYIDKKPTIMLIQLSDVFFVFSGVFFYLFYTQPDSDGYGGYIVIRLALLAFLIMVIWICATIKNDIKFGLVTFFFIVIFNFVLIQGKKESICWLNSHLKKFDGAMDRVKDGDVVAPVFIADYIWLGGHFSNYVGADKEVVILDNYEASSCYFPVLWKDMRMQLSINGKPESPEDCVRFVENLVSYPFGKINYVLVYGEKNDNENCVKLMDEIRKYYVLDFSEGDVFLYKRKDM